MGLTSARLVERRLWLVRLSKEGSWILKLNDIDVAISLYSWNVVDHICEGGGIRFVFSVECLILLWSIIWLIFLRCHMQLLWWTLTSALILTLYFDVSIYKWMLVLLAVSCGPAAHILHPLTLFRRFHLWFLNILFLFLTFLGFCKSLFFLLLHFRSIKCI